MILLPSLLCLTLTTASALDTAAEANAKTLMPTYRWFHQHPELSLKEHDTAKRFADALQKRGLEVHRGVGGHGVVGILRNRKYPKGPTLLYRADMDALPVNEATGLSYASKNAGVMHACGHDLHMSMALGVSDVLRANEEAWRGTVVVVGQPAEELGKGAVMMLEDRQFTTLIRKVGRPKLAIGVHNDTTPVGTVTIRPGYAWAAVDMLDIHFFGRGGHGARPHQTIDPIVMASDFIGTVQTVISRRLAPQEPAVITVGSFQAGTKHNIIPDEATLLLTVRTYGEKNRDFVLGRIRDIAGQIAYAHGAPKKPTVSWGKVYTPSIYNDPWWTERLTTQLSNALGRPVGTHQPFTVGEDFGQFGNRLKAPSVLFMLGAAPKSARKQKNAPGLHSAKWAPDAENALREGIRLVTHAIAFASQEGAKPGS